MANARGIVPMGHQATAAGDLCGFEGRLIADERGCGKTVTAILLDEQTRKHEGDSHPTLIICPKGAFAVWRDHLLRMGVDRDLISVVEPLKRERFVSALASGGHQYHVMNWDAVDRLQDSLTKVPWLHIIGDEVHRIKGRATKRTVATKRIKAQYRTGLTGTPADNKPDDFWSVLNWLYRQEFSSYWKFVNRYCETFSHPGGYHIITGVKNIPELRRRIKPWYRRRYLRDVAHHMAKRMPDMVIEVDLTPEQRRLYNKMYEDGLAELKTLYGETDILLSPHGATTRLRLQQFAIGTPSMGTRFQRGKDRDFVILQEPSAKVDAVVDWMTDGYEKVVIGTQFKASVDLMCNKLSRLGIEYVSITGDSAVADREHSINRFHYDDSVRAFVATIGSSREAIDLTAARTVIFLDRAENPTWNDQFIGRVDRLSQTLPVQVIDIVARDTVEYERRQGIDEKASWLYDTFDNPEFE
jgi:SNF2 family DNA or RNA helicase